MNLFEKKKALGFICPECKQLKNKATPWRVQPDGSIKCQSCHLRKRTIEEKMQKQARRDARSQKRSQAETVSELKDDFW